MLSIIIPSYKDPYIHKTIDSLIDNAEGDIEIVVVLDGYWPEKPIKSDKRIKVIHLGANRGMRGAINAGVQASSGEFLMRMDEHQIVSKGYDVELAKSCQENWIVTPIRFFLDPVKWEIMNIPPVIYSTLKIKGDGESRKFTSSDAPGIEEKRKDIMIDEIFGMQGSCWFMRRSWWDKVIGELQTEGYGPLYQDSHEMVFKTWKAGGKLMVNKNVWHAHKHKSFRRTHNNGTQENPSNNEACFKYSLDTWEEYYNELVRDGKINVWK